VIDHRIPPPPSKREVVAAEKERERNRRLRADFEFFCTEVLVINPKAKELFKEGDSKGVLIPFVWNKAQRKTWLLMQELIAQGLPIKLVVLKARQVGISTFFCAYLFWQMWRQGSYRAGVVAYEKQTTLKELNECMATFYEGLPDSLKPKLRAAGGKRVSLGEVYFDDRKSNCMFAVQTPKAIRGVARDGVLTTEVSFYDEADEFYGGFLPSMSDGPSSLLVLESSPADGWFKDTYFHAKRGESDRRAHFIAWWMCDDLYIRKTYLKNGYRYDARTKKRVELPKHIRQAQARLTKMRMKQENLPVSDEQMWWWHRKCEDEYQGDEEWMRQEYPDDDVTAFQRATRSAFKDSMQMVNRTVGISQSLPVEVGTLTSPTYDNVEIEDQIIQFNPERVEGYIDQERHPGMFMFRRPVEGYTYVIGADVADGEGEEDEEGERAFSAACVYCCNTREQVASWRGHIDPTDYGDELVKLGYFYNTALSLNRASREESTSVSESLPLARPESRPGEAHEIRLLGDEPADEANDDRRLPAMDARRALPGLRPVPPRRDDELPGRRRKVHSRARLLRRSDYLCCSLRDGGRADGVQVQKYRDGSAIPRRGPKWRWNGDEGPSG